MHVRREIQYPPCPRYMQEFTQCLRLSWLPLLSLPAHAQYSLSLGSLLIWFVFLSTPLNFIVELLPFYFVSPGFSGAQGICVFRFFKEQGFQNGSRCSEAESLSWDACSTGKCHFCSHFSGLGLKDSLYPCCLLLSKVIDASLTPSSTIKTGHNEGPGALELKCKTEVNLDVAQAFTSSGPLNEPHPYPAPTQPSAASHSHKERLNISNSWNTEQISFSCQNGARIFPFNLV